MTKFRMSARRRRQSGFTLIEVAFSMIVFLMMIVVFAAVFPFAIDASRFSNNYAQAALLAQHKIDQLRQLGYSNLMSTGGSFTTSSMVNDQLADSCSVSGSGTSQVCTCAFTDIDNVADNGDKVGYYPAGSTATYTLQPDGSGNDLSETSEPNALNVHVTIAWAGGGMPSGHYTIAAKMIQMTHN